MGNRINKITVSFKERETELYEKFIQEYCSPSARIKDLMRKDLCNKENPPDNTNSTENITTSSTIPGGFIDF